jgi:hypothetical protein
MKWGTGDDMGSGNTRVSKAGDYHMVIEDISEPAVKPDGTLIQNSLFGIVAKVFATNAAGQEDKEWRGVWFNPNLQAKDGGKFDRKKVDRFLLAVGLINPSDKGIEADLELSDAIGRQFLVRLEENQTRDGKTVVQMKFADIYHVDDPEAADIPKSQEGLSMIPAELRRVAKASRPGGQTAKATAKEVNKSRF